MFSEFGKYFLWYMTCIRTHHYFAITVRGRSQRLQAASQSFKANQIHFIGAKQVYTLLMSLVDDDDYSLRHFWYSKHATRKGRKYLMFQFT